MKCSVAGVRDSSAKAPETRALWKIEAGALYQGRHGRLGFLPGTSVADRGPQGSVKRRRADLSLGETVATGGDL